jgi:hypothetical protein
MEEPARSRFRKNRGASQPASEQNENDQPLTIRNERVRAEINSGELSSDNRIQDRSETPAHRSQPLIQTEDEDLEENARGDERHLPLSRTHSRDEDPKSRLSSNNDGLQSNPDHENEDNEEGEEGEQNLDEEMGLLSSHQPYQASSRQEQQMKLPLQDIPAQNHRIKRIRDLADSYTIRCFSHFLHCFHFGYDIYPLQRIGRFQDVNKTLTLESITRGLNIGVTIKEVSSYKHHLIGMVKPFVRIYALNVETGLYVKSIDELPLKPIVTKGKLATNNCSKVTWNEDIILDAEFADLASESTVLLFEIVDQRSSLSFRKNFLNSGNSNENTHQSQRYTYKKIAWGYLLPVGVDGRLNVRCYSRAENKPPEPDLIQPRGSRSPSPHPFGSNAAVSNQLVAPSNSNIPSLNLPQGHHHTHHATSTPFSPIVPATSAADRYNTIENIDNHYKIQLHYYHDYDDIIGFFQRNLLSWSELNPSMTSAEDATYPNMIPSIYSQWKLLKRLRVEGCFLELAIGSRVRNPRTDDGKEADEDSSEG